MAQTIVATQVRNGGSRDGRNVRFEICVEIELIELEGKRSIKNILHIHGLCNWIGAYAVF